METIIERKIPGSTLLSRVLSEVLTSKLATPLKEVQSLLSATTPEASPTKTDSSLPSIEAVIVDIIEETHDTKSYCFTTDLPLESYRAGSHINIEIQAGDDVIKRTYTLSSSPKQINKHAITVKRVNDGLASNWLFENLCIGDKLRVSQPQGDFVLPYQPAGKILLLSAGSGITPVMSMLRYLTQTGNRSDITFLHYAQSPDDIIFRDEISTLALAHPGIRTCFSVERSTGSKQATSIEKGRISQKQLVKLIPDVLDREIYLCGPQPFMKATMDILNAIEFNPSQLHFENFTADLSAAVSLGYSADLTFSSIEKTIPSTSSKTILEEAEAAGLQPEAACRMGICKTCRCKKQSGTTVNLMTGEESNKAGDYILPCVSVAKTATTVEL